MICWFEYQVVYFRRVTISWWVGIEPTSGQWKMSCFTTLSYPMLEWKHNFTIRQPVTTLHYIDATRLKTTLTLSTEFVNIMHCWLIQHPFSYKKWQTRANNNVNATTKTNPANRNQSLPAVEHVTNIPNEATNTWNKCMTKHDKDL